MSIFGDLTDGIKKHIGGFRPRNRDEAEEFFEQLPLFMHTMGESVALAADHCRDSGHIAKPVVDAMYDLSDAIEGAAEAADEVFASHRVNHRIWLSS